MPNITNARPHAKTHTYASSFGMEDWCPQLSRENVEDAAHW